MCAVSVALGYMIDHVPISSWTPKKFDRLHQAIALLETLDEELGQPDCADETKLVYLDKVHNFLYPDNLV